MDTIFAVSSGAPPAAIAIVRISGNAAFAAVTTLVGRLPGARRASLTSRMVQRAHGRTQRE